MRTLVVFLSVVVTCVVAEQVLYDFKHHIAVIVRPGVGCYEYHMNHQETSDAQDDALRPGLETKMLAKLNCSSTVTEQGHHSVDHLSSEIRQACTGIPIYGFESHQDCLTSTSATP
ncbi:uncharacterized protein LOC125665613 [Ostrea edulis]|uniref:uncharacterized protein LOC125665613 n=1 Tax=Ostrea edulis TaxID=37623 RepID=UPI0020946F8B|nr:uncharacterized protein LOC125665613 [Ostrea edulis]